MFWNSQSAPEKEHLVRALRFELGMLDVAAVRERMVGLLAHVDKGLATRVAEGLGLSVPVKLDGPLNRSVPADADSKSYQPRGGKPPVPASAALSMANTVKDTAKTRKVAILAADGVDSRAVNKAIAATGAGAELLPAVSHDRAKGTGERASDPGLVVGADGQVATVAATFIKAIAAHRNWGREATGQAIPG